MLLELSCERRKKALSSLLYARDEEWPERLQVIPGVPLYRQGPGGLQCGGRPAAGWPAGSSPAGIHPAGEPDTLLRPDSLGDRDPVVTKGFDDDVVLYG